MPTHIRNKNFYISIIGSASCDNMWATLWTKPFDCIIVRSVTLSKVIFPVKHHYVDPNGAYI